MLSSHVLYKQPKPKQGPEAVDCLPPYRQRFFLSQRKPCPTSGSLVYTVAAITIPLSPLRDIYPRLILILKLSTTAIREVPYVCTHTAPNPSDIG